MGADKASEPTAERHGHNVPAAKVIRFSRKGVGMVYRRTAGRGVSSAGEKAARNQVVFREVNERIAELTSLLTDTGFNLFICEFSDSRCAESLQITATEYEAVRDNPIRFLAMGGHEKTEVDRVVDGKSRYLEVEAVEAAGELAGAGDARRI